MNAASKAFRRSSVRLKSFSVGHNELNMIISDMKEVRSAAKRFVEAQETAWKNLAKWAGKECNVSVRDTFSCLKELNHLWTEVQTDFVDQLNKFKYSFEVILEGEMSVDKLRERLSTSKEKEMKLTKELQKAKIKSKSLTETRQIEQKLNETKSFINRSQIEFAEKTSENEVVKAVKLKQGLVKVSEAYVDMAHKSSTIFDGTRQIVLSMPEGRDIQDVRYRGMDAVKQKVTRIVEAVKSYQPRHYNQPVAPPLSQSWPESPPPPYTSFSESNLRLTRSVRQAQNQNLAGTS